MIPLQGVSFLFRFQTAENEPDFSLGATERFVTAAQVLLQQRGQFIKDNRLDKNRVVSIEADIGSDLSLPAAETNSVGAFLFLLPCVGELASSPGSAPLHRVFRHHGLDGDVGALPISEHQLTGIFTAGEEEDDGTNGGADTRSSQKMSQGKHGVKRLTDDNRNGFDQIMSSKEGHGGYGDAHHFRGLSRMFDAVCVDELDFQHAVNFAHERHGLAKP